VHAQGEELDDSISVTYINRWHESPAFLFAEYGRQRIDGPFAKPGDYLQSASQWQMCWASTSNGIG
jgi:hypothetical protein